MNKKPHKTMKSSHPRYFFFFTSIHRKSQVAPDADYYKEGYDAKKIED